MVFGIGIGALSLILGIAASAIGTAFTAKVLVDRQNLKDTLSSNEAINKKQCEAQVQSAQITAQAQNADTRMISQTDIELNQMWRSDMDKENVRNEREAKVNTFNENQLFPDTAYEYPNLEASDVFA